MADLFSTNRNLVVMRHEHAKLVALSNLHARDIRIMELQEEIERMNADKEAQKKVIEEADKQIAIHSKPEEKKEPVKENK